MNIEIYGIPEQVWRCPGCHWIRGLLASLNVEYTFIDVISPGDTGPVYDRPLIESLAKRLGQFPSLSIKYPVIFVDNQFIPSLKDFQQFLIDKGYGRDLIED